MEGSTIRVPMVGRVIEVKKKVRDAVHKKNAIAVLDSMKMKIPIFSTVDGVVQELNATVSQILNKGHVLGLHALIGGRRIMNTPLDPGIRESVNAHFFRELLIVFKTNG